MGKLLCPCCLSATLTWLCDWPEDLDLDTTVMQCNNRACQLMYKGMGGWLHGKIYHGD